MNANEKLAIEKIDNYRARQEKLKRGIEYFRTLKEGVDYIKEATNIKAPLEVFQIKPISEKGVKYFKGEY